MTEWSIIATGFNRGKCENPNAPNCANTDRLLWIKPKRKPHRFEKNKLYICAECIEKDFQLVGEMANSWKKFK